MRQIFAWEHYFVLFVKRKQRVTAKSIFSFPDKVVIFRTKALWSSWPAPATTKMDAGNKEEEMISFRPEKQFQFDPSWEGAGHWHWAPSLNWSALNIFLNNKRKLAPPRSVFSMADIGCGVNQEAILEAMQISRFEREGEYLSNYPEHHDNGLMTNFSCCDLPCAISWHSTTYDLLLSSSWQNAEIPLLHYHIEYYWYLNTVHNAMQLSFLRTWLLSFSAMQWFSFSEPWKEKLDIYK